MEENAIPDSDHWTEEDVRPPHKPSVRFAPFNAFVDSYASIKVNVIEKEKLVCKRLTPIDALIFTILWRRATRDNTCTITHARIAKIAGLALDSLGRCKTVRLSIKRLISAGCLKYLRVGKPKNPSIFQLFPPTLCSTQPQKG